MSIQVAKGITPFTVEGGILKQSNFGTRLLLTKRFRPQNDYDSCVKVAISRQLVPCKMFNSSHLVVC